jgi:hypothetical protein
MTEFKEVPVSHGETEQKLLSVWPQNRIEEVSSVVQMLENGLSASEILQSLPEFDAQEEQMIIEVLDLIINNKDKQTE